jgi:hypothetical protein
VLVIVSNDTEDDAALQCNLKTVLSQYFLNLVFQAV